MKLIKNLLFIVLLIVGLSSCSQGRWVYTKSYHKVQNKKIQKKLGVEFADLELRLDIKSKSDSACFLGEYIENESPKNDVLLSSADEILTASLDKGYVISINSGKKRAVNVENQLLISKPIFQQDCDLIIFTDGTEVQAKVLEVGSIEIKYKECSNLEGPTFSKYKTEVFMIKYANGTSTVIKKEKMSADSVDDEDSIESEFDKSQTVAFVLCLLLGALGIHRFYLGHIGIGILYLLTGGLCGIGVIVDLILIGTGNLKPKKGNYKDRW